MKIGCAYEKLINVGPCILKVKTRFIAHLSFINPNP